MESEGDLPPAVGDERGRVHTGDTDDTALAFIGCIPFLYLNMRRLSTVAVPVAEPLREGRRGSLPAGDRVPLAAGGEDFPLGHLKRAISQPRS